MADVTPWLHRPGGEVLERLEWSTDVIQSFDATEQRIALRSAPRRVFEFAVGFEGRERRYAENLLHKWQAQPWGLPVWMDAQRLASVVTSGATSVPCETTFRDFSAGGLVCLTTGPMTFEVLGIDSVSSGSLTLSEPTTVEWPVGTEVVPVRMARMADSVTLRRFTGNMSYGTFRFECIAPSSWPAATGGATYRAAPVLEVAPNWVEDPEQQFARKVARVDPGTGAVFVDEEGGGAVLMQSHRWLLDGRAQIDAFRRWLYARQGRRSAFWLPTFAQDLAVVASIGSAATTIDVEHCGYTDHIAQRIGRRDIRILLASGTAYMRRITGSTEISAAVERLTIDSALGVDVPAESVVSISYMDLVRQAADAVELSWWTSDVVEASLVLQGSRNDL